MNKFIFNNLSQLWFKDFNSKWAKTKNRSLFEITKTIVGSKWTEFDLLSMGKAGVFLRDSDSGKGKFPSSFKDYQIVKPGDLIFCLYDIDETPRTVGHSELNGMITSSYTIVKCFPNVDAKFLYYLYMLIDNGKGLKPFYTGLRNSIRPETFMNIEIRVPDYQTQKKIRKKLDKKMENIINIIDIQKSRIALMNELKNSLIYNTFLNE